MSRGKTSEQERLEDIDDRSFDKLALLLALILGGLYLYLGITSSKVAPVVVSGGYLLGIFLYATPYWHAFAYFLAAVYTATLMVILVFHTGIESIPQFPELAVTDVVFPLLILANMAYLVLASYLFFQEAPG